MTTDTLAELRHLGLCPPGAAVRLHLGCGQHRLDGYVNVDLPPASHNVMTTRPDLERDLTALRFPRGAVDEIRLHHVFEHFSRVAALGLLVRWHEWLEMGGVLHVETPDLRGSAELLVSEAPLWHKLAAARHLAGDQAAPWGFHVDLWFPERFRHTLERLGFEVTTSATTWPEPPHLANVEVRAVKRVSLSRAELLVAADELLWESTVSRVERPTWEVWRAQLRAWLDGAAPAAPPAAASTPALAPPAPPSVRSIVFSKDRPLQLEAALRSLLHHVRDRQRIEVEVLYLATTAAQRAAYRALAAEYPSIRFVEQRDFRADLLRAVAGAAHVLFLVDDTLFVSPLSLGEVVAALEARPGAVGFTLRLGRNTTYVYTLDRQQPMPDMQLVGPGVVAVDWKRSSLAFAYPLEVSSSVYRGADVARILDGLAFENPNSLEAAMAAVATPESALPRELLCFERSVAFSAPLNVVQQVFPNRAGGRADYAPAALCEAFLRGDRIDVEAYDGRVPASCHEEVDLVWLRGRAAPVAVPDEPAPAAEPSETIAPDDAVAAVARALLRRGALTGLRVAAGLLERAASALSR